MPPSAPAAPLARYAAFKRMGDFVFLSGIIAVDPARMLVVNGYDDIPEDAQRLLGRTGEMSVDVKEGPILAQSWYVLDRIRATIESAGGSMGDVFKLVQYFRDLRDYPALQPRAEDVFPHRSACQHRRAGHGHVAGRTRAGRSGGHGLPSAAALIGMIPASARFGSERENMVQVYDIEGLKRRLGGIKTEENPALVKQKSRDFYWYSPILKRQLDHVTGDILVSPVSEAEVVQMLAAAFALGIPVTPRGAGTGNYGQAMPLSGGIVLDLSGMDTVHDDRARPRRPSPAGAPAMDHQTRAHSGQELRLHPSTYNTASIGGFIAGGSGGVGSIRWGGLRDFGNVIGLKVVTMEASPRVLDLDGEDIHKVGHAYGTNGIIVQAEMPLAPAYDWIDMIVGFDGLRPRRASPTTLGEQDGLLLKQPRRHRRARRRTTISPGTEISCRAKRASSCAMIAPHALDACLHPPAPGRGILFRAARLHRRTARACRRSSSSAGTTPPCAPCGSTRPSPISRCSIPSQTSSKLVEAIHDRFGDEVPAHLEFVRFDGKVTCFGLPLVRFTTRGAARRDHRGSTRTWARRSSIRIATRSRKAA